MFSKTSSPLAGEGAERSEADEGNRAKRDGFVGWRWRSPRVEPSRSHLAPLDPPHPAALRASTFPRNGGKGAREPLRFSSKQRKLPWSVGAFELRRLKQVGAQGNRRLPIPQPLRRDLEPAPDHPGVGSRARH